MKNLKFGISLSILIIISCLIQAQTDHILFQTNFTGPKATAGFNRESAFVNSIAPSDSIKYQGHSTLRADLKSSDPFVANGIRAELTLKPEKALNVERWLGFNVFLPGSFIIDPEPEILMQWHDSQNWKGTIIRRPPPLALSTQNGHWLLDIHANPLSVNDINKGHQHVDLGAYKNNVWTNWVFHIRFSGGADGLVEVWKNGKKVATVNGPNSYTNSSTGNYFKLGIYKWMWMPQNHGHSTTTERTVYYGYVKIGDPAAGYKGVSN